MGLIGVTLGAVGGVIADQYKEYFCCEALPADVLVKKGEKKNTKGQNRGTDNVITNGSTLVVADGQCLLIVEQGKIIDVCAEPGAYKYDSALSPSFLTGGLNKENLAGFFKDAGNRIAHGGETGKDQRVYYVNTREIMGNKYGTANPVPFRVVDARIGLDVDISIKCFGEYSFRITNPLAFYTNVCSNVSNQFTRTQIESQLKSELLTALQPAFAKISEKGIRYSALPGHTMEIAASLNEILSAKWRDQRGIEIVEFGVNSVKADPADEQMIKDLQKTAALTNQSMLNAYTGQGMVEAMKTAAGNSAGAMTGFMGVNMAGNMMGQNLYQGGGQPIAPVQQNMAPAADTWTCPTCGNQASGKFCTECGTKKPAAVPAGAWICPTCGKPATGKFCPECGTKKPAGVPQYKCDKCGWVPEDPANPPRFCPECGDPFGDEDLVK